MTRPASPSTNAKPAKVGIVGLGLCAKVLTRAAASSGKTKIIAAYSRSEEKRRSFQLETRVPVVSDLKTLLSYPMIDGVIITVPSDQHLPVATEVAKAKKHIYIENPIAGALEHGLAIAALEQKYGITVTVGHSARLLSGIRKIREAIDSGELGTVALIEANFSRPSALEPTPDDWGWHKDRGSFGSFSRLALQQFDVLHYLGGGITEAGAMAAKLSPIGSEEDDQSMTLLRFADGKVGYVGSSCTSPGVFAVRVFGSKALMHYEIDLHAWNTPEKLPEKSTLYLQRGKDGYTKRENLRVPESDIFHTELEMFAESCRTGRSGELSAANANFALSIVYAAMRSIDNRGQSIRIADILRHAQTKKLGHE
jgi:predicted dehydrogenase